MVNVVKFEKGWRRAVVGGRSGLKRWAGVFLKVLKSSFRKMVYVGGGINPKHDH